KKRFYAWDEMSAKRSLIPSARALSHMGVSAGDASAEELIGHLLAEQQQQQHNQQQLTPNMFKRGM
uniref:Transcriptional regulator n=1 Tax=Meloidogyne hapla TaxID=6305 RepID=A0A1I8BGB0_MELHA